LIHLIELPLAVLPFFFRASFPRHFSSSFGALRGCRSQNKQESCAVARKSRDTVAVLFGLKFADNIHYKFKSSQASKARLQSSKHTGTKHNLTQNGHSRSFKVTRFKVSGEAIRD